MKKRVLIIHGWGGWPNEEWLVWLKNELETRGFEVMIPEMPDTDKPTIKSWLRKLSEVVGLTDENTYFVGHSIGCQAIMRYLEQLPDDQKVGGVVFVAGWFNLTDGVWDETYTREIADEWINTPIDFEKTKQHTNNFVLIASDNDPYVSLINSELFRNNLNAKIIVLKNKGHISEEDGVVELSVVLEELLKMAE
ncbi:MAG: hypothetical protein A2915_04070 [Candidatus Yanofskybacteria bacterium RIFCSPLOWO2_01_FULL_41_34]|uniref:Alpha/beta hydrolase n=1 Tax=Candidatus Yanofskybacteria bacterium RIFCSPHIGHO2_01_FULL_41_26 TaxID=1802661 RepID=A0A1F8EBM2_9BACT|nr:MAG: hypothetical protein A2649_03170 [Candidatus Yanofskybacteria bacterium RIFCSPHIGHO2_01_FULL_41_26]OGN21586.1 MAG: hypothetical protein A2915_04070 [Candidatus Yanofskybacteria bacterium RIFCSPLOWO2_01_FULL_41_34]